MPPCVPDPPDGQAGGEGLRRILEEISHLTSPRTPPELVQDSCGLFMPGFTGLPSVSVLEARPIKGEGFSEEFRTGQLFPFETVEASEGSDERFLTFFSPIENMRVPPVHFSPPSLKSRSEQVIQMESEIGWDNVELHFVWLPWDTTVLKDDAIIRALIRVATLRGSPVGRLRVSVISGDQEIPLHPRWGLGSWVPGSAVEGMTFPLVYARRLMEPFVFRVSPATDAGLAGGGSIRLDPKNLALRFSFPEADLAGLYSLVGLGPSVSPGFTVLGNILPVANVDLKAWVSGMSYREFIRTCNMRLLGFAGAVPFKARGGSKSYGLDLNQQVGSSLPNSTQIALGLDSEGEILCRFVRPEFVTGDDEYQLLLWVTHGDTLNGRHFKAAAIERIQPMQAESRCLRQAITVMPCFGGCNLDDCLEGDMYDSLMLNYNAPPQMLLCKPALINTVKLLLAGLGYSDRSVSGPFTELRLAEGGRQRVTTVSVKDNLMNPMKAHHIAAIQDYLDQRAPLGSKVFLEVR